MNTRSKTDKTATACQKTADIESGATLDVLIEKHSEAIKAAIPSPLPWRLSTNAAFPDNAAIFEREGFYRIADCDTPNAVANARLIVASVNNAEALAEALCEVIATGHDHNETGGVLITHEAWQACKDALANWEGVQQ